MKARQQVVLSTCLLAVALGPAPGRGAPEQAAGPGPLASLGPLSQAGWYEARTSHFHTYSCGPTQEVARLAARLEQFHDAYAVLAGTQAVASPPIVVMAFPSHAALEPFLPLHEGKPINAAALFNRNADENLIVLSLSATNARAFRSVFHEYTHLLLRHNQRIWPLWLTEGMAEIYATFEVTGDHGVRVGQPIEPYLRLLREEPWLSLEKLFVVTDKSPEYSERDRQRIFYAESWLLTHYLMLGGNARYKEGFGQLTTLLRAGQAPRQAFTNALHVSLSVMEKDLRGYLERGRFQSLALPVKASLFRPQPLTPRRLTPAEVCFRLGDQLLRIGRLEAAESCFLQARRLAPESPLALEGLGFLAAERGQRAEAVRCLGEAVQRGSTNFLAHYGYALQRLLRLNDIAAGADSRLPEAEVAVIRSELERALALMPDFGPAYHALGSIELLQQENLAVAEEYLRRATQLEPEREAYVLSLALAQLARTDRQAARRTLESLQKPYVDAQVRTRAAAMLKDLK